jgi:hypothetical protein
MSIFISFCLAAFAGVLHLASQRQLFTPVCGYTLDLCQHPSWPLWGAAAFLAFGLLFRLNRL